MRRRIPVLAILFGSIALSVQAGWPDFRGLAGDGHAVSSGGTGQAGLPVHWSETNHVKWKTAIPYRGWSTPVIWDDQIWLTTATPDGKDFFAISVAADSGKIL